jgi:hypothetical protein
MVQTETRQSQIKKIISNLDNHENLRSFSKTYETQNNITTIYPVDRLQFNVGAG